MSTYETERALKLVEKLGKVSGLDRIAERMKLKLEARLAAVPMSEVLAKMPQTSITAKARAVGVSRQTFYLWLHDATRPDEAHAQKLAKITGFSVAEIRGRADV